MLRPSCPALTSVRSTDSRCSEPSAAKLAAVRAGQAHVKDHPAIETLFGLHHRARAVVGFEHVEILGHQQLFAQGLAQVVIIVYQQDLLELCHGAASFVFFVRHVLWIRRRQAMR